MKHLGTLCGASLFIDTEDDKIAQDARKVLAGMAQAYFQNSIVVHEQS